MIKIITFGCRLNFYESEVIKNSLEKTNVKNLTIIHSCAVTNEAERQVQQTIRREHRTNSERKIIVVGCAVELDKEKYEKMPGVIKVLSNKEKLNHKNYSSGNKIFENEHSIIVPYFGNRSRAFVQIQNGCNHSCTFCAITHARGNNRSIPITDIINQVKILLENGHKEIVLTGVDITDFGSDLPGKPSLGSMIKRLLNTLPNLQRLRLSSVDVAEIDKELFDLIVSEKRLMPHIHISAQSGDDMILKRMKRRHNRRQIIDFCQKVKEKRPEVVFGADMISGFPTETEEMFENSYNLILEAGIIYLHVFPYSPKMGTAAARMPQVDPRVKKNRAKLLRELGSKQMQKFYKSQLDCEHEVILEKKNYGRAQNFSLIRLNQSGKIGSLVKTKIIGNNKDQYLIGITDFNEKNYQSLKYSKAAL
ncbi:MAG: tRNA (N(6)-L-threonylcarbamoyladenosine(37)-C(2))-methylthiotransferase MtaB [Rickettsiaceae bacterium H1]|nr:tRNA (N(6)-L-threonylcarbamoyladenosine(37)-C(2))-methylthiotransferase MtaB [Rickettsiaceae bacterium H1]